MKVVWTVGAREKLKQIVNFIAADSPTTAIKYGNDIFTRTESLLEFPEIGLIYRASGNQIVRKIVIGKTKTVYYRVSKSSIYILAIHDNRKMLKTKK